MAFNIIKPCSFEKSRLPVITLHYPRTSLRPNLKPTPPPGPDRQTHDAASLLVPLSQSRLILANGSHSLFFSKTTCDPIPPFCPLLCHAGLPDRKRGPVPRPRLLGAAHASALQTTRAQPTAVLVSSHCVAFPVVLWVSGQKNNTHLR